MAATIARQDFAAAAAAKERIEAAREELASQALEIGPLPSLAPGLPIIDNHQKLTQQKLTREQLGKTAGVLTWVQGPGVLASPGRLAWGERQRRLGHRCGHSLHPLAHRLQHRLRRPLLLRPAPRRPRGLPTPGCPRPAPRGLFPSCPFPFGERQSGTAEAYWPASCKGDGKATSTTAYPWQRSRRERKRRGEGNAEGDER